MNNMDFTVQESATPFQMYLDLLRKTFSGPLFLALTIIMTCLAAFQTLTALSTGGFVSLSNLVQPAMAILTTVACWMIWNKAKNNGDFSKHLGMMRTYPTFLLVIYYIGAIACGLVSVLMFALSGVFKSVFEEGWQEAWEEAMMTVDPGFSSAEMQEIEQLLGEIGPYIGIIFGAVLAIACVVLVLMIIRETKLVNILKAVSTSTVTGKIPQLKTGFYTGSTYAIIVIELLGLVFSGSVMPFSLLASLCTVAVMIIPLIILSQVKNEIKKYEALQINDNPLIL